ncbi:hypothetical protein GCM10027199_37490 [Amycolatopsis magusensis]
MNETDELHTVPPVHVSAEFTTVPTISWRLRAVKVARSSPHRSTSGPTWASNTGLEKDKRSTTPMAESVDADFNSDKRHHFGTAYAATGKFTDLSGPPVDPRRLTWHF